MCVVRLDQMKQSMTCNVKGEFEDVKFRIDCYENSRFTLILKGDPFVIKMCGTHKNKYSCSVADVFKKYSLLHDVI